jgi:cytidylate kinase
LSVSEYEAQAIETERARRRIKDQSFNMEEVEIYLQKLKERSRKIHEHQMRALESLARRESNNSIEDNSSIIDRVFKFFYDLVSGH